MATKKELQKRIEELELKVAILEATQIAMYPVYVYLYRDVPYNPYWQPYRYVPDWTWRDPITWLQVTCIGGTTEILGDWKVYGTTQPAISAGGTSVTSYSWNIGEGAFVDGD